MPQKDRIPKDVAQILQAHFIREMNEAHALGQHFRATLSEAECEDVGHLLGEVICAIGNKGLTPLLKAYPELSPTS